MATCKQTKRCHVKGKGITTWGKAFPAKSVKDFSSSGVVLVAKDDNGAIRRVASGTLVHNNVVLCANHSLSTISTVELEIMLFFECDAKSAPAGHSSDSRKHQSSWRNCTVLTSKPQAKVVELLEKRSDFDYAFLRIEWSNKKKSNGLEIVTLPGFPDIPDVGSLLKGVGEEVLLIGHPWDISKNGEPKQASVGVVSVPAGPHPRETEGRAFTYASIAAAKAASGMSGGGVFNKNGQIIGLMQGGRKKSLTIKGPDGKSTAVTGNAFMNIASVASITEKKNDGKRDYVSKRIRTWYGGGVPLLRGETKSNVVFKIN